MGFREMLEDGQISDNEWIDGKEKVVDGLMMEKGARLMA